jgi:hypothetical protein
MNCIDWKSVAILDKVFISISIPCRLFVVISFPFCIFLFESPPLSSTRCWEILHGYRGREGGGGGVVGCESITKCMWVWVSR